LIEEIFVLKTARIITIGDELVRGEIVNSNAAFIAKELERYGIRVSAVFMLPDHYEESFSILERVFDEGEIFIFTGGLGGTQDDITRRIVSSLIRKKLVVDEQKELVLRDWYESRGRNFEEADRMQAAFPEGGRLLENRVGLAYGFYINCNGRLIFSLPGVPHEMKSMFLDEVIPILRNEGAFDPGFRTAVLTFIDLPEYILDRMIQGIVSRYPEVHYGTRASNGIVRVKFDSSSDSLLSCVREVEGQIHEYCIGQGDRPIEEVVGNMLAERKLTLSAAESCTGGLLAKRITDVPGSSSYFLGSVVSYSNEAKERVLGVERNTLMVHGAVSEETAVEMAIRAKRTFASDISLSITGIAGPGGGTEEKPVGRVYICLFAEGDKPVLTCNDFLGDREAIRIRSVNKALSMLFRYLREKK